jgi:hypothetical protein
MHACDPITAFYLPPSIDRAIPCGSACAVLRSDDPNRGVPCTRPWITFETCAFEHRRIWATSLTVRMRAVFSMYLLSPVRSREWPVGTNAKHFFRMIFELRKIHLANLRRGRPFGILGALSHRLLSPSKFPQDRSAFCGRIWLEVSAFYGRSFGILGAYLPICPIEKASGRFARACAFVENVNTQRSADVEYTN